MFVDYLTLARTYMDYVLYASGAVLGLAALIIAAYLFSSRKKSRRYKTEISETISSSSTGSI
jgi:hypothetical protein